MAAPNANQLFLLADHIKLSLLERQRAISLNLEPNTQDGHISRSLDSMREGIDALEQDHSASTNRDQISLLRQQFDDLTSQFHGYTSPLQNNSNGGSSTNTISQPNDPSLASDFAHAKQTPKAPRLTTRPANPTSSSFLKRSSTNGSTGTVSPNPNKSVRFRDSSPASPPPPHDDEEEINTRAALFPYRDDPSDSSGQNPPDQSQLSNQQIHLHHSQVLREQDQQLDRLGESIGRQRDLSIQIGDELDEQVQMLDEMDGHVDRHQSRLDRARKSLGDVARKAKDNKQITVILVLIIILVFLIVILK